MIPLFFTPIFANRSYSDYLQQKAPADESTGAFCFPGAVTAYLLVSFVNLRSLIRAFLPTRSRR